jgi:hypothetical protein
VKRRVGMPFVQEGLSLFLKEVILIPQVGMVQGNTSNYTPQLCFYPPSTAQPSQNFTPFVPMLLLVHLVKDLSYTPRNLSLVKNLIPLGGIIRGFPCSDDALRSA